MRAVQKTRLLAAIIAALTLFSLQAAPPQQREAELGVARVSLTNGDVTMRRGDSGDWVAGRVNMPLVEGDSLATGRASRAEIQLDSSNFIRLNENSEVHVVQLGNRRFRVQVAKGIVTYSELRGGEADIDIETPHVAVRPTKNGLYRVEVTPGGETRITVRSGEAQIASRQGQETLEKGRVMIVRGTADEPEFRVAKAESRDDWDRWNQRRDKRLRKSVSRRYVDEDIYGVEDLDRHGRWRHVPGYGYCWFPRVSAGWAPYRHGRWLWLDYYGWSWVGYEPWGWAPYHYGRWYRHHHYGWGWYPGHHFRHHYWRPALVTFFGFGRRHGFHFNVGFGFGHIGWVPLAPHEVFHPWYGRHFLHRFGHGIGPRNTTILVDNSVNIYNNYRNARAQNGVTLVDAQSFSKGRVNSPRTLRAAELRRATAMRGQIPVVPARSSQGRIVRASNTSAESGTAGALRRSNFFSRRPAGKTASRTPFEQQREQISRSVRAFADANGRRTATAGAGGSSGRVGRSGTAANNATAGGVRSGAATRSRTAALGDRRGAGNTGSTASQGGVRSSGSGSATASPLGAGAPGRGRVRSGASTSSSEASSGRSRVRVLGQRGGTSSTTRGTVRSGSSRSSRNDSESPNWRTFGRSRTAGSAARSSQRSVRSGAGTRSRRGFPRASTGRRGTTPTAGSRTSTPTRSRTATRSNSRITSSGNSSVWRRFGGSARLNSSPSTRAPAARSRAGTSGSIRSSRTRSRSTSSSRLTEGRSGGNSGFRPRTSSRVGTRSRSDSDSFRRFRLGNPVTRSRGGAQTNSRVPRTSGIRAPEGRSSGGRSTFVPRSRSRISRSSGVRSGSSRIGRSRSSGSRGTFAPRTSSRSSRSSGSVRSGGRSIPRVSRRSRTGSSRSTPRIGRSRSFGGFGGSVSRSRSSGSFGGRSVRTAPRSRSGGSLRSSPSRSRGGSISRSRGSVSRGRSAGRSRSSGRGSFGRR